MYPADLMSQGVTKLISGDFCWISTLTLTFVAAGVVGFLAIYDGAGTLKMGPAPNPGIFGGMAEASKCPPSILARPRRNVSVVQSTVRRDLLRRVHRRHSLQIYDTYELRLRR